MPKLGTHAWHLLIIGFWGFGIFGFRGVEFRVLKDYVCIEDLTLDPHLFPGS